MKRSLTVFVALVSATILSGQSCETTVDTYKNSALPGYNLMSDYMSNQALLFDMNGNLVHQWYGVVFPAKLLPGGDLLLGGEFLNPDSMSFSPDTEAFVQVSWAGEVVSEFRGWEATADVMMARQHHDFEREGNPVGYWAPGQEPLTSGKTLILAHRDTFAPEITDHQLAENVLYEIDADGNLGTFQWRATQHFDEFGFDAEAMADICSSNVATLSPEGKCDALHINTASYLGPNLWYDAGDTRFAPENIIISSRHANFMAILSHETGEVVWRVGPDFSEGMPEHDLGQIQGAHHVHMVPEGLPGAGNILVLDNGGESGYGGPNGYPEFLPRLYSRVIEFNPITLELEWEYGLDEEEVQFYSNYGGAVQRLPNGHTVIGIANESRMLEVDHRGKLHWDFVYGMGTTNYRAYRIPPEWLPEGANVAGYTAWQDIDFSDSGGGHDDDD